VFAIFEEFTVGVALPASAHEMLPATCGHMFRSAFAPTTVDKKIKQVRDADHCFG
jgi:hypothetical protein